ncbi:hypothetical protein Pst134EA_030235 [Puccinia striiformis f. sp. tritici]|uniref:hypothetical protein n=1 Tax=Puccinia striiformis f. sp. tritici TaxID=168172 RepID=UPI002008C41E|nr:hypothetical protein Pst134EA_030235 [Puccinia striiformis f. sp. tritici]KAH9446314.1 hypothetical protein Pst134EA_030235 [Puccinia striiformis f. sp. tritici]
MKEKGIHTGALMMMVPTLVVTSIGAGWQPRRNTDVSLADPASGNPTASTTRLWCDQVEVHPDTDVDNPVYVKMGASRHKPKVNPPDSPVSTRQIGYENDENTKTP